MKAATSNRLQSALDRLIEAGLLFRQGVPTEGAAAAPARCFLECKPDASLDDGEYRASGRARLCATWPQIAGPAKPRRRPKCFESLDNRKATGGGRPIGDPRVHACAAKWRLTRTVRTHKVRQVLGRVLINPPCRLYPQSGHRRVTAACPFCANSGHQSDSAKSP
jgi:hypothetical protein